MPYPQFDRSKIRLLPLAERTHDFHLADAPTLDAPYERVTDERLATLALRVLAARSEDRPVVMMMGAHIVKCGLNRYVIEMVRRGWITHVAMNGAGPIHDFELALIGATSESVPRYISSGQFGLWRETGRLNDIAKRAADERIGLGEAIGREIADGEFPWKDFSICAAGFRLGVPITVHIGVGYDIIHEHPNCDGTALGASSYTDFLVFSHTISRLEGGALLCFGSAVMGPEVYLKALAMARNVAHQSGERITRIATAVFDLLPLEGNLRTEALKSDPRYYYRPWKTILARTVADGGESRYFCGDHRSTIPSLYHALVENSDDA